MARPGEFDDFLTILFALNKKNFPNSFKLPVNKPNVSYELKKSRERLSFGIASKKVTSKNKLIGKHRRCGIAFHKFKKSKIIENCQFIDEMKRTLLEKAKKPN